MYTNHWSLSIASAACRLRVSGEHSVHWHLDEPGGVVYLETVLHGSNLASASDVTTWFGTSFLTPVFGAIVADTFLGNYNTIIVSLVVYLLVRIRQDANRFYDMRHGRMLTYRFCACLPRAICRG